MAKSIDIGTLFEGALAASFDRVSKTHALYYHKLADTGSVAGYGGVAGQPCDFIVGARQRIHMLEAKASVDKMQLSSSMLRPSQLSAINKWQLKVGCPYLVMFYSGSLGRLFVWEGASVLADGRLSSKSQGLLVYGAEVGHMYSIDEDALDGVVVDLFKPCTSKEGAERYIESSKHYGIELI